MTSGKDKGTGLGTYSARLIARAHGGDIRLTSSEQENTVVSIFIPDDPERNHYEGEDHFNFIKIFS